MNNDILGLVTNLLKDTDLTGVINDLKKNNPNIGNSINTSNVNNSLIQRIEQLEKQLIERETQLTLLIHEIQEIKNSIESINQQKSWFSKFKK
ncbi:hypothetical protein V7056_18775 [Bacillus sp. JJ664]